MAKEELTYEMTKREQLELDHICARKEALEHARLFLMGSELSPALFSKYVDERAALTMAENTWWAKVMRRLKLSADKTWQANSTLGVISLKPGPKKEVQDGSTKVD
jgi:hypothetical protein